ncbi:MAG: hypothetical protein O2931_16210 [Planctomycetota bacterium]|nr:hypothetical protein [Planctomycetota bacterium]MDA1180326.1 hypothetical protein [Planctomycetota bacterium]
MRWADTAACTRLAFTLAFAACGLGVIGCAGHRCRSVTSSACRVPPTLASYDRTAARSIELDTSIVSDPGDVVANSPQHKISTSHYYGLLASECQLLSAAHCSEANLLEQKATELEQSKQHGSSQEAIALLASACRDLAIHLRNRSAAEGLRLYFRLLEAEGQRNWNELALHELDSALADYRRFKDQGVQVSTDASPLHRQRHELQDQHEQLWLASAQSQGGIRLQIGLCANDSPPIWPASRIVVSEIIPDLDATIANGLCLRRDLSAMRRLCQCESGALDPKLMGMLSQATPSMAIILSATSSGKASGTAQRSMICCSLADQEQVVEEEIRQAARSVESSLIRIALAKQELARTRERLSELESLRGSDHVTLFDLSGARLQVLRVEGELTQRVVAWQLSVVGLWEATGQLTCTAAPIVAQTAPSALLPPALH